ncbi:hypothetical protein BBJ28_00017277 [Nothophytophthora sp. Chile5]|nr:hypothetical protein BBJ28_00017277 [Nothophytophthora sp. Chile5]
MARSQHRDSSSAAWLAPDHEETGSSRAASLRTQEELPSDRDSDYYERERVALPPNLYELKRQHRPDLWGFVRLIPKASFTHLPVEELTSSHAAAAFCLKCRMTIPFQKAQHFVKQHMQKYHANTLREYEKKKPAKRSRGPRSNQSTSSPESVRMTRMRVSDSDTPREGWIGSTPALSIAVRSLGGLMPLLDQQDFVDMNRGTETCAPANAQTFSRRLLLALRVCCEKYGGTDYLDVREMSRIEMHEYDEMREQIIKRSREILKSSACIDHFDCLSCCECGKQVVPELVALTELNPSLRDGALSASLEEYAEAKCFFHYLDTRCLLQRRDVPSVRTNEYLGGVIDFTGELMRLAVVKATSRDVQEVERCKAMVEAISGELIQFAFRNGPLRRKFDSIKYNLQKLEVNSSILASTRCAVPY